MGSEATGAQAQTHSEDSTATEVARGKRVQLPEEEEVGANAAFDGTCITEAATSRPCGLGVPSAAAGAGAVAGAGGAAELSTAAENSGDDETTTRTTTRVRQQTQRRGSMLASEPRGANMLRAWSTQPAR